jgi:rubrerythrin
VGPTKVVRGVTLHADPAREPCFKVVDLDAEMEMWDDMSDKSRRERLHRHMNNEAAALEIAAKCVADFPDAPWPLRLLLARQAADEARHAAVLLRRCEEIGGRKGEFPVANFEWSVTMSLDNLPARLAVQNRTFEAGLIDILGTLRTVWRAAGDDATADVLDGILADEITHVRFANRWIRKLTEQDARVLLQVALAVHFLGRANSAIAARAGEVNASGTVLGPQVPPAVNVEDRLAAEFTEDEVLEVLRQAGFRSILPHGLRVETAT